MRHALFSVLLALTAAPAIAEAKVDFKCESVNYSDQIGGWISFGYGARGNSIIMEFWNGYPPITLVDAPLDNGNDTSKGTQYISEPDRTNETVATIDVPRNAHKTDKFEARIDMRYVSPETKKLRIMQYDLKCVRH